MKKKNDIGSKGNKGSNDGKSDHPELPEIDVSMYSETDPTKLSLDYWKRKAILMKEWEKGKEENEASSEELLKRVQKLMKRCKSTLPY